MKKHILVAAFAVLCFLALPVFADEDTNSTDREPPDTLAPEASDFEQFRLVHADSMTLTQQEDEPQIFKGAVDIVMVGTDKTETRIKAEIITVHYQQDVKRVREVQAEGKVEIQRLGTVATTERAVFRGDENIIELLVKPHVKDSRGEITADRITIFADSDKVVAEGNVKGTVYPEAIEEATAK
jgi:lipopolysaccharide transport protein LptA